MSKMKVMTHKKGFRVFYKRMKVNKAVLVNFCFNAGFYNDIKLGLAHFAEHAVAFGSEEYPGKKFRDFVDKFPSENFVTNPEHVFFWVYSSVKDLEEIFKVYSNVIFNVQLKEEDFENERKVIIQEITHTKADIYKDSFVHMARELICDERVKFIARGLGTEESVRQITIADVQNFYDTYFKAENLNVVVVGNVSKRKLNKYIETYLVPNAKTGFEKTPVKFPNLHWTKPNISIAPSSENEKSRITIMFKVDDFDVQNFYNLRFQNVLNECVDLFARDFFRIKNGLTYHASCYLSYFSKQPYFFINVFCNKSKVNDVLNVMPEFIKFLKNSPISQEKKDDVFECVEKREDIAMPHPRNYERTYNVYDMYGRYMKKSESNKIMKKLKKLPVEEFNQFLAKVVSTKPKILIEGNLKPEEVQTYSEFQRKLSKALKKTDKKLDASANKKGSVKNKKV